MTIKMPHTFTIIFILIVISALATWFIPSGNFKREYSKEADRELVVPGTYTIVKNNPQGIKAVLTSFTHGLINAADVVAYVLIVGGAYGIIMRTKAIDAALNSIIIKLGSKTMLLIPIIMTLFSIAGATTGFWEESLPFYLIIVPLIVAAGYDALIGVAIIVVGAGTGVMASLVNPFSVGIASSIAEISLAQGFWQRVLFWGLSVIISISYVLLYAIKVKKNPKKSIVYSLREEHRVFFTRNSSNNITEDLVFNKKRKLIVLAFIVMIISMIYCIVSLDWWFPEITMLFLLVAIFSAIVMRFNERQFWEYFLDGSKDLLIAALVIGFARGIVVIAQDGLIIDTILYQAAHLLEGWSSRAFIILNEVLQIGIAFLVPSSSGQAALTMPIMSPLADLIGVPRVGVVASMVFSSGLANLVTPTAGVLMAGLGMARVSWIHWAKFIIPLVCIQYLLSVLILMLLV